MSDNQQDEIIETIRMESVIALVNDLVEQTGIDEKWSNYIFEVIHEENERKLNIRPEQLAYDAKRVHEKLSKFRCFIEKQKDV